MTTNSHASSSSSRSVSRFRLKIRAYKRTWSRLRLGKRGRKALSRVLTSKELPVETLAHFNMERVYTHPKEDLRRGGSNRASIPIIAERKFAVPGIGRFLAIIVRPYTSDQEVVDGYNFFFQAMKNRFSHLETSFVEEGELALPAVPEARFIELKALHRGNNFRIFSIACVIERDLLITEYQCDISSSWDLNVCEQVILKQIAKLKSNANPE
jgi:hypothetical protein